MTEIKENVIIFEDLLATKTDSIEENTVKDNTNCKSEDNVKIKLDTIPKGKPKSGRIWKEPKKRFSSIVKTRGIRLSFEKKQKLREDLKRVKELSREIIAQKQADKEAKKERRRENMKRAKENERKGEIVQVIKNTVKINRMKRKHLRTVEKRDTVNM